jgi:hypothetical protein
MTDIIIEQEKKKNGCLKGLGIGCLVVIVLAGVGGFFGYKAIKGTVSKLKNQYTQTTPIELPEVDATEHEVNKILTLMDSFNNAIDNDKAPNKLVLTSKDINILIQKNEDWAKIADKIYVELNGDKISGQVSIPLGEINDMFEGQYLNGSVDFQVGISAGRLVFFLDSVKVGDKQVPDAIMKALSAENLADKANRNPEVIAILEKLKSIKVKDSKLYIVPKEK